MASGLPIYLDNHATTRLDPRVLEAMRPYLAEDYGNAASHSHAFGWRAEAAVEAARERLAAALGARSPGEITFTSGATESNNLAVKGLLAGAGGPGHVVSAATEHRSLLDPCRALAAQGHALSLLPVDGQGLVDPDAVRRAITPRTRLVSIMAANNEIGVLQPLEEIGAVCRERGVLFHSDAAQALGRVPLDVERLQLDLLSASGHKLYGPKGVGLLYVRGRARARIAPLLHGGGQEGGLRPGTVPVPLVVGLAAAVELCVAEGEAEAARLAALRDRLLERVRRGLDGVVLNGHPRRRLPGNLNLSFAGVDGQELLRALGDVALSSGSACTSARPEPSHVLAALGLEPALVRASLRFGIGRFNTREEIDRVAERLVATVREVRRARPTARRAASRKPDAARLS